MSNRVDKFHVSNFHKLFYSYKWRTNDIVIWMKPLFNKLGFLIMEWGFVTESNGEYIEIEFNERFQSGQTPKISLYLFIFYLLLFFAGVVCARSM